MSQLELQRAFDGWRLKVRFNGALVAEYTNAGPFQCQSNNPFTVVHYGTFCQSWPSQVIVRPVG